MEEIHKFRIINKLKSVYRFNSVDDRKESSAEHSWSCLVLADFLLNIYNFKVDRLRVYELLMYHDLVEIKTRDYVLKPNLVHKNKKEEELEGAKSLKLELPEKLANKYFELFQEYEDQKTKEARFAKAIDQLDAEIHELDYKQDWQGWTKKFLIEKKLKYFEEFPELKEIFLEIVKYLEENTYFDTGGKLK